MSTASPRWRKVLGDVRAARGRFIGIAVAMALTIAVVATILVARAILAREMNRNYLESVPASADLSLDVVDDKLLNAVRRQPGIVAADRAAFYSAQSKLPSGETVLVLLRVVPDFAALKIAKFYPQSGAWPPAEGEVLIERAVSRMTPVELGAALSLDHASGRQHTLRIAGTVHDPGNAPAWQERVIYGYITAATLAQLDANQAFDQLQVVCESNTTETIEASMRELAIWLRGQGRRVDFIRIPPPGKHPHQWQIDSVALLLLCFGVLAIVLEAALLAIVIGGLLAPQIRQIAVMKAIGARTTQIVGMYSALVIVLALAALTIGVPLGVLGGKWFAGFIMGLLNFDIVDGSVPGSVFALCLFLGLLTPFFAALWPIVAAARKSVRESIDYYGVASSRSNGWLQRLCNRIRVGNVGLQLAIRNLSRRKAQLAFAVSLLVLTGAVFMLAGNALALWQSVTSASIAEQRVDIQVRLRQAVSETAVTEAIRSVTGVRVVEPSRWQWANIDGGDGLSLSTRSVPLRAVISGSDVQRLDVETGRWFRKGEQNTIVLNAAAHANLFPNLKIGDWISLLVNGKSLRLQFVGVVREFFGSATAYTTAETFAGVSESPDTVRTLTVGLQRDADPEAVADAIEAALAAKNFPVRGAYSKASNDAGISAHTYMLIAMLLLIVTAVAKVAVAGLASCMSTAVIERTREFGVMRTLGARAYDIQSSIILEAVLIGVVSWVIAIAVAIPLTMGASSLMNAAMNRPLPLVISPTVMLLWLLGVMLVAIVASVAPARRAANLTIRQTLDHS